MRMKYRPMLETLEDRTVPAVSLSFSNGYAVFTGDRQDDTVKIIASTDVDTGNSILTATYNSSSGKRVVALDITENPILGAKVSLGNGGDAFRFEDRTDGFDLTSSFNLYVDMGNGPDAAVVLMTHNIVGADTVINVNMKGGEGKDWLNVQFIGDILEGATVNINLDGGKDADTVFISQVGVVEGNVNFLANGGDGKDFMRASFDVRASTSEEPLTGVVKATMQDGGDHDVDSMAILATAEEGALIDSTLKITGQKNDIASRIPGTVLISGLQSKNIYSTYFHSFQTIPFPT